ncbi:SDR family NAD(P)-dependent oxidoreductase [Aquihabitans sp. McL0605]|uniref:SDR family NAD(P)-dependent oxidoreductase n=1 Tax=Aquihabitans sp. McL0605 TaxID=3415671 RepID=UPI003CEA076B
MTFGFESTTDDVLDGIDLTGHWVLVTGASSGLGQETARAVAARGANVVLGVRDVAKGEAAAEPVRAAAAATGASVELRAVDLASLSSIRAFTDEVSGSHDRLDAIIANAGVMGCPEGRTDDGFELQFGTNHLGHFLLVNRLRPLLAGGPARIINLSSAGHRFSDVVLDDINFEQTAYDPWISYGRSKTANVLFTVELDRRGRDAGQRSAAVHPGSIMTDLGRHLTEETLSTLQAARAGRPTNWKTVPQGAATSVWAGFTADADEMGGNYCEDCGVASITDDQNSPTGVFAYALDPDSAKALWARSEELVAESFPA